jgi:glucokinase-like ROK family protein
MLSLRPDERDDMRLILDAVRFDRAASRAALVEVTGLSRAVVAQRVAELIDLGLVAEEGMAPSAGGRPPRQLRFRADAGYILAADLGATSVDVAIADLSARILDRRSQPADIAAGPEVVLAEVDRLFGEMTASLPESAPALVGVGLGIPGPVEFETGRPVSPPIMPGWDNYGLRERLEARYQAPVWVDNDANLMAMGEWRHGRAAGEQNVVFVKVGTGIGAGLIADGVLHRGSQGAAGDVGHIQVGDDVVCRCGNVGCLEAVAGGQAIARDGLVLSQDGRSSRLAALRERDGGVSAATVAEAARHGDPASLELIITAGRVIGGTLASVVNFFNPSLIVIGGGVAGAGDSFLAAIRESVYRRSLPLATRELRIEQSALGDTAGVIGAAAVVADELFGPHGLAGTLSRQAVGVDLVAVAEGRA